MTSEKIGIVNYDNLISQIVFQYWRMNGLKAREDLLRFLIVDEIRADEPDRCDIDSSLSQTSSWLHNLLHQNARTAHTVRSAIAWERRIRILEEVRKKLNYNFRKLLEPSQRKSFLDLLLVSSLLKR